MGAWIEIHETSVLYANEIVALYMGAWIEMLDCPRSIQCLLGSHSIWVRGLKSSFHNRFPLRVPVALYMGAWIEI